MVVGLTSEEGRRESGDYYTRVLKTINEYLIPIQVPATRYTRLQIRANDLELGFADPFRSTIRPHNKIK